MLTPMLGGCDVDGPNLLASRSPECSGLPGHKFRVARVLCELSVLHGSLWAYVVALTCFVGAFGLIIGNLIASTKARRRAGRCSWARTRMSAEPSSGY